MSSEVDVQNKIGHEISTEWHRRGTSTEQVQWYEGIRPEKKRSMRGGTKARAPNTAEEPAVAERDGGAILLSPNKCDCP